MSAQDNIKNKENFGLSDAKDICHYSCSKLSTTNLLIMLLILVMICVLFK
jgi:hypothetical protein